MKILTLDLATKTGWAIRIPGLGTESGVQEFPKLRGESNGMRFLRLRAWLTKLLEQHRPDVVLYEQAHHRGGAATELCVGFVTRVQELCAERDIDYQAVHSGTLKKHATGRGNAKKPDMIAAAKARWPGQVVVDDNQADALCLLSFAIETVLG